MEIPLELDRVKRADQPSGSARPGLISTQLGRLSPLSQSVLDVIPSCICTDERSIIS